MKQVLSFAAVLLLLSPAAFVAVIEDWTQLTPGVNAGSFADTLSSKIEFSAEDGPNGAKAFKLKSTLAANGWCGVWHSLSADLSKNKSLKFKVKTSTPGQLQVALQDKYNVQYIASCPVSSKEWTVVTIPLSSFIKNPYYTPPNAMLGFPMDLSRTTNMNLASLIPGESVVEVGPLEAVGTAPAKPASGASSTPGGKIVEDWYLSPF